VGRFSVIRKGNAEQKEEQSITEAFYLSSVIVDRPWSLLLGNYSSIMMHFSPSWTKAYQSSKYLQEF